MQAHGKDRGGIAMSVIAPILAAVIGGGAAIGAAYQFVNLAPSNTNTAEQTATQLSTDEIDYGDR